jgi:very-short-patch-repair endonuclease
MSSLEQVVADMLDDLKIEWEREVPLKYLQGYRYYDFKLIGYNVLLEVDGAYYHDKRDKPSYVIMMAKRNDYLKNWIAKKEGYELIRIKEQQLKEEYNAVVQNISLVVSKEGEQNE